MEYWYNRFWKIIWTESQYQIKQINTKQHDLKSTGNEIQSKIKKKDKRIKDKKGWKVKRYSQGKKYRW